VRWALEEYGLLDSTTLVHVNLLDAETDRPEHRARNPMGFVPVLEVAIGSGGGAQAKPIRLTESVAIIDWLDRDARLLPSRTAAPWQRAQVLRLVETINSATQPLQNIPAQELHSDDPVARKAWAQHWVREGLSAFERWLVDSTLPLEMRPGAFCVGDAPTAADLYLIPQVYNAKRIEVPVETWPTIARIYKRALELPACDRSKPELYAPKT